MSSANQCHGRERLWLRQLRPVELGGLPSRLGQTGAMVEGAQLATDQL
jgi:hypothetical protein